MVINKKILAPVILFPLLFSALLLCITKYGSCEWVGVEWLDFGAQAPSIVFLLPCSLFAPSLYLKTPLANTLEIMLVDFAISVSPHTNNLGIVICYCLVSFILPFSYMKERQTDMVRGRKKRGEGYVVKPKMAACSSKGGETETENW